MSDHFDDVREYLFCLMPKAATAADRGEWLAKLLRACVASEAEPDHGRILARKVLTAINKDGHGDVKKPAPPQPQPMTEAQAGRFGSTHMTWGKYRDRRVADIYREDREYLAWLVGRTDFAQTLEAYMTHMDKRGSNDE